MNNKKITMTFILIATLSLLGIIGFTIAYFTSSTDFENEFQTGLYQTTATEVFESPSNWMPGDTTPKTLTITNTGNVDVKARVCISEEWTSSNDDTLPNEVGGVSMAIINLDNTSDWTKKGNCYIFNDVLEPNDTTSSFIQSVTFNPDAEADLNCTTTTLNGTTTKECTSTGDGYDNATYKLTLTVETVQANKADEVWSNIKYTVRQRPNLVSTGDEIKIGNEEFYVVRSEREDVILLAKYNLLVGDIYDTYISNDNMEYSYVKTLSPSDAGYGLQSSEARGFYAEDVNAQSSTFIGVVPFSSTNYWDNRVCQYTGSSFGCTGTDGLKDEYSSEASYYGHPYPNVYNSLSSNMPLSIIHNNDSIIIENNGYTIAYFVEEYTRKIAEIGGFNNIEGRLLTVEEIDSLGCNIDGSGIGSCNDSDSSWLYNTSYWLGSAQGSVDLSTIFFTGNVISNEFEANSTYGVRPVLKISSRELNINSGLEEILYGKVFEEQAITIGNSFNNRESFSFFDNHHGHKLKIVVRDGIVEESYVEIHIDSLEASSLGLNGGFYSFRGGGATYNENTSSYNNDSPYYEDNVATMKRMFGESQCIQGDNYYSCSINSGNYNVYSAANGFVILNSCTIEENGKSYCEDTGPA